MKKVLNNRIICLIIISVLCLCVGGCTENAEQTEKSKVSPAVKVVRLKQKPKLKGDPDVTEGVDKENSAKTKDNVTDRAYASKTPARITASAASTPKQQKKTDNKKNNTTPKKTHSQTKTEPSKTKTSSATPDSTVDDDTYYSVVFRANGKILSSYQLQKGQTITPPPAGDKKWYVWDKQVPSAMPSSDLIFTATAIAGNTWDYNFKGCLSIHVNGNMSDYSSSDSQPWKDYKLEITSIKFDNTVTKIGKFAFFGLENLTTVVIPNNVTKISDFAFTMCDRLESVTFGQNLQYIGKQAFASSINLTNVQFLGRKFWYVKDGKFQTTVTFGDYGGSNATLLKKYSSYIFSSQEII